MQKFILFLKRYYFLLLFIVLEVVVISFYANSTSYTKAKLLSTSNVFVGGTYRAISGIEHYLGLKSENKALIAQIAELNNRLATMQADTSGRIVVDSAAQRYVYGTARVINNSVSHQQNFFTLNKGIRDGVQEGMAVLSADGVAVGYVLSCSNRFSVCMSMLNTAFRSSGKVKGSDYFGSLLWEGRNSSQMTLSEVSKYADIKKGDTILTTSYSAIFPPDVMIGTIDDFALNDNGSYFVIKVKLATEISALGNVVIVRYIDATEQKFVEQETAAAQQASR